MREKLVLEKPIVKRKYILREKQLKEITPM
jgi:hypothetical protein